MTTTIYLIRHGETEWNRSGRWQGHADVPLSPDGFRQAEVLATRLVAERIAFDHIYASDLSRAMETARIVARALGMPVQTAPALREINVGAWSGLTRAEIVSRFPGAFDTILHPPDGEPHDIFAARVGGALTNLAERHPLETLAIVTHGGTIRAMLKHVLTQAGGEVAIPFIGNTSLTILRLRNSSWSIVRLNDMAHLAVASEHGKVPDTPAPPNEASSAS